MFVNQKNAALLGNVERARIAWGSDVPRWVLLLAQACDATSQRAAAERIGKSSPYVSRILRREYNGDYAEAEKLVRAAWGGEDVICPLWGAIPLANCMSARRREAPPTSRVHHIHLRACPTCPNNSDAPTRDAQASDGIG